MTRGICAGIRCLPVSGRRELALIEVCARVRRYYTTMPSIYDNFSGNQHKTMFRFLQCPSCHKRFSHSGSYSSHMSSKKCIQQVRLLYLFVDEFFLESSPFQSVPSMVPQFNHYQLVIYRNLLMQLQAQQQLSLPSADMNPYLSLIQQNMLQGVSRLQDFHHLCTSPFLRWS